MQSAQHLHARRGILAGAIFLLITSSALAQQVPGTTDQFFDSATHSIRIVRDPVLEEMTARLLTSSCAACHGTNGHSVGITPSLAGIGREHFIRQMRDFSLDIRPGTVMNFHAKGYTRDEVIKMADYFSNLPRSDCDDRSPISDLQGGIGLD